ncbi:MAG: hypothetical protein HZB33_03605 [Nitrospirae bacterium]|nr:hypothetical protein [Nitrospirota bacterium]
MLRISHKGGEKVSRGNYWNYENGERVSIDTEGRLPGDGSVTYYKANPLFILAAGPVLGLLYAAFLPFIGIAIVLKLVVTKLFASKSGEFSKVATFNWNPAASYLAGRKHKEGKGEKMTASDKDKKEP